jgi:membrane carboxypeptidase/penicillin-binding protein
MTELRSGQERPAEALPVLYGLAFKKDALRGYPVVDFVQPKGIEWTLIDPKTGLLALSKTPKAYLEAFLEGTVPTMYCNQKPEQEPLPENETPEEEDGY